MRKDPKFLSLDCYDAARSRVTVGTPDEDVARFIQDRGEWKDIPLKEAALLVGKYRAVIRPDHGHSVAPSVIATLERQRERMDEVNELEDLYRLQLERIRMESKFEKNMGKLLPTMTQEIRVAKEILTDLAQVKMDLGIHSRHLGTVDVSTQLIHDVSKHYPQGIADTLNNDDSRRKILGIAERMLNLVKDPETSEDVPVSPDQGVA